MTKAQIPPKYRPFVFGLHALYLNDLKPQQKSVDWKTTLQFMNSRDTAQALYAINWEIRAAAHPTVPVESNSMETTPQVQEEQMPAPVVAE